MKKDFSHLEKYRIRNGPWGSEIGDHFGVFFISCRSFGLRIISADGEGFIPVWEHVSISLPNRNPNWEEMCFVKSLFWEPEETVIQIHPPESVYVNQHPFCLHLWKLVDFKQPLPPSIFVGLKTKEEK